MRLAHHQVGTAQVTACKAVRKRFAGGGMSTGGVVGSGEHVCVANSIRRAHCQPPTCRDSAASSEQRHCQAFPLLCSQFGVQQSDGARHGRLWHCGDKCPAAAMAAGLRPACLVLPKRADCPAAVYAQIFIQPRRALWQLGL
jgi:hypothetical protein